MRPAVLDGLCPTCVADRSLRFARVVAIADSPVADRLRSSEDGSANARMAPHLRMGDYEIEGEIARGGMGVVYRARQLSLDRPVALKLLLAGQFADAAQVRRFRAEAAALARLDHPTIVPVYEVGEYEHRHFFSMKLIEGPSLAAAMPGFALPATLEKAQREGVAPGPMLRSRQRELVKFMTVVALAVHYAHQRGVLHRDLKPGNVLLDPEGNPHVTDFGLARLMGSDSGATASGLVFGTPAYMPPEQTREPHGVTTAADVYSLGAITYELLTGRPPFEAGNPVETVIQVRNEEPIPPRQLEPTVNCDLETIVLKCLEKDPARRYGTALALADEFERFSRGEPVLARPVSSTSRLWRWSQRHPAIAVLSASVVLLVLLLAVGGPMMAFRIADESDKKEELNRQYRRELQSALLAQARAERLRGEAVHRETGLEAVASAAGEGASLRVLNEAVAQLARVDISGRAVMRPRSAPEYPVVMSPDFEVCYEARPGGAIAALSTSNWVTLWNQTNLVSAAAGIFSISPDGGKLAMQRDGYVTLLRASDGEPLWSLRAEDVPVFSPDGAWILVNGVDRTTRRYDTRTGVPMPFIPYFHNLASEFSVSPTPALPVVAQIYGRRVDFLELESGRVQSSLEHSRMLRRIAWQDNRLAVADDAGSVVIWRLPSRTAMSLKERLSEIRALRFVPETPMLLVVSRDGQISCWNTDDGARLLTGSSHLPESVSADGTRLMIGTTLEWGMTRILHPEGRRRYHFADDHNSVIRSVVFNRDSRLMAVVKQAGVYLVDLQVRAEPLFIPHFGAVAGFFDPDTGDLVVQGRTSIEWFAVSASGSGPRVQIRNRREWTGDAWLEPGVVTGPPGVLRIPRSGTVLEVLNLRDGTSQGEAQVGALGASTGFDGFGPWTVFRRRGGLAPGLMEGAGGRVLEPFGSEDFVPRFSPDGRWLLASGRQSHRTFSVRDWVEVRSDPVTGFPTKSFAVAAWSPDSKVVAGYEDSDGIVLRDVESGAVVVRLTTPVPAPVTSMAFSPGGRWLAVGTSRGSVELWDFVEMSEAVKPLDLAVKVAISRDEAGMGPLPRWLRAPTARALPAPADTPFSQRDPRAGSAQLDLTRAYNAHFEDSWLNADIRSQNDSLSRLPVGLQTINGVTFDVRGIVQLSGHRFRAQPIQYPVREENIPVGLRVQRLHLIGAAADVSRSMTNAFEIARVRLHYRDGQSADLPLMLTRHLGDHWVSALSPVRPKEAQLAWRGLNAAVESASPPLCLELSHVTLANPYPDREVATLDLISVDGPVAPYLIAITVE